MKNTEETFRWLNKFHRFGIKLGLERIRKISEKLGYPEKKYPVIHVGGTNGKGTVCQYLNSVIQNNDYNVGLYTSPHLTDFSERIKINNIPISEEEIKKLMDKIKPIVESFSGQNQPTYFEIVTAMALQYFADKKVDISIIEVGLGGRYDATNIVTPLLTIITNVSLEHQDRLGETIEEIAYEKAGIIKKDTPVVTGAEKKAYNVIKEEAAKKNSPLIKISKSNWRRIEQKNCFQKFRIKTESEKYELKTCLQGLYQGQNLALVTAALEILQEKSFQIKPNSIKTIQNVVYPGRMEIKQIKPMILLDGAHNSEGIKKLSETLKNDFHYKKLILVFGVMSDKKIKEMLSGIIHLVDTVVLTKPSVERSADPLEIKKILEKINFRNPIFIKNDVGDAVKYARKKADGEDLICITGSLFTVGEAKKIFV
ncbi:MAG: folylpolyglutamate synthase/dihydrofolate synthase family protein [Candidatus Thermoplasmatota archaeon]